MVPSQSGSEINNHIAKTLAFIHICWSRDNHIVTFQLFPEMALNITLTIKKALLQLTWYQGKGGGKKGVPLPSSFFLCQVQNHKSCRPRHLYSASRRCLPHADNVRGCYYHDVSPFLPCIDGSVSVAAAYILPLHSRKPKLLTHTLSLSCSVTVLKIREFTVFWWQLKTQKMETFIYIYIFCNSPSNLRVISMSKDSELIWW